MLTIISSTNRKGSYTLKLSKLYKIELDNLNIKNQIFDLKLLPQNFIFKNFSDKLNKLLDFAEKKTINNTKLQINLALNYGSKNEIVYAFNKLRKKKRITKINPTISEVIPDLIESSPKSGPTVRSSTTSNGVGKAPDLSSKAKSVAS